MGRTLKSHCCKKKLACTDLVGCVLHPMDSKVIKRRHPHLRSLAKDVKLVFYTILTGNGTPGLCVAVHYTTATPRQRHSLALKNCTLEKIVINNIYKNTVSYLYF